MWRTLLLLTLAELLGMSVWFSASAVVPALTRAWSLSEDGRAWLTMSVQIGFVVGALTSAVFNLADRYPIRTLFTLCSFAAAGCTAAIAAWCNDLSTALVLRFLTGFFLAGVYPVGMKLVATWTREHRGLAIGLVVGALTFGSAAPHLINAYGGVSDWRPVLYQAAALGALGGVIAFASLREGPYRTATPPFDWRYAARLVRDRPLLLANLGYLGHMWELYAAWTWLPAYLTASFALQGVDARWAGAAAFVAIASGGVGSIAAGKLADRLGRTTLSIAALLSSGACTLGACALYGGPVWAVTALMVVWGITIIADSAQFSAAVSELCEPAYTGTALALQTCAGFLLTMLSIRLIPTVERAVGWRWAFAALTIGPLLGAWAMFALRRSPAARKLAGGRG